ncbi:MAG: surE 1 [Planctomycetota bacterium]|nr:surE 1 [Planctomycetota bacterium]
MRLILTNDDGIDAPGLAALVEAARGLGDLRLIAPDGPQSGCGHAVTTHRSVTMSRRMDGGIAVAGTPADCVRLGLHHLAEGAHWVLSGINAGGNLGADVFHSGTVAAAREAVLHGTPAIAVSHYLARRRPVDWDLAAVRASKVLRLLIARPWSPGTFWNVNLPHPEPGSPEPGIVFCPLDTSPLPLAYRVEGDEAHYSGDYQARARRPGSDVDVCFKGSIAVSLVSLAATFHQEESPMAEPDVDAP